MEEIRLLPELPAYEQTHFDFDAPELKFNITKDTAFITDAPEDPIKVTRSFTEPGCEYLRISRYNESRQKGWRFVVMLLLLSVIVAVVAVVAVAVTVAAVVVRIC